MLMLLHNMKIKRVTTDCCDVLHPVYEAAFPSLQTTLGTLYTGLKVVAERITVPDFVKIGQSVAKILRLLVFFQDGDRPPSWI